MLQILGIAACIALVAFLVTSAAALTYTAIILLAGVAIGLGSALLYFHLDHQRQQLFEERRRDREHQRTLELIMAASKADFPILDLPKSEVRRLGRKI